MKSDVRPPTSDLRLHTSYINSPTMFLEKLNHIKAFVLDVDGVMTNGMLLVTESGEFLRQFNIKDGYAMQLAVKQGFKIAVHSHAGLDRCALLVCTWLIYREKTAMSSHDAMALFRAKRFNSKLRKGSSICKRIERFEVCNLYLEFRPETDEESLLQKGCNRPANSLQCGGAGLSFG